MTTKLKAELERAIDDFIQKNCEDEGTPSGLHHPDLAVNMAAAAALVYDANFSGQEYADRENEGLTRARG